MAAIVLAGANIRLYVNSKLFTTVQSISFTVDYGETPIYGIDAPYAQEIAPGRVSISGSCQCIRIKNFGGLQGANLRPLYSDFAASPYISIRIQDRQTKEDIIFIPNAKVTKESHQAASKTTYKLSFDFIGQIGLFSLDRT